MNTTNFALLVPWIIAHGYLIFFLAALIEGPFVTAAGGIAAALGYYNIFLIILLAIAGDLGGDVFYYGLGYRLNKLIKSKRLWFLGITPERVTKIEGLLHKHIVKAVLFVKMAPVIGPAGLMILGAVRAPFKKVIKTGLYIVVPKSVFFALVGFYSAKAYLYLDKTIIKGQYILGVIVAIAILLYLAYKAITAKMAKELEK